MEKTQLLKKVSFITLIAAGGTFLLGLILSIVGMVLASSSEGAGNAFLSGFGTLLMILGLLGAAAGGAVTLALKNVKFAEKIGSVLTSGAAWIKEALDGAFVTCSKCRYSVSIESNFCPQCGAPMFDMEENAQSIPMSGSHPQQPAQSPVDVQPQQNNDSDWRIS